LLADSLPGLKVEKGKKTMSTKWTLRIGLLALLVALAGLVGCGDNAADSATDTASAADTGNAEQTAADDEQDLAAREREMQDKLAELEAREAAVEQREATSTPKRASSTPTQSSTPQRASTPRPAAPAAPTYRTVNVTLPASTALELEFAQSLSSEESAVGDPVRARVTQDVVENGVVAVPAGSEVTGQVTEARAVKKIGGQAKLAVMFDMLHLPTGEQTPITSSIEFLGKKQTGKDAATIGGSAAGGAVLGRVLGGKDKDKATAIGAVVGAAVGTAVAANNKTDPVLVETGQTTQALLVEPVHMQVVVDAQGNLARR